MTEIAVENYTKVIYGSFEHANFISEFKLNNLVYIYKRKNRSETGRFQKLHQFGFVFILIFNIHHNLEEYRDIKG